uniref:Uncharacterized protein n=1 Tax=Candidozyma auris TaxID=498019 RepID=A0A0L0NPD0_CANAR
MGYPDPLKVFSRKLTDNVVVSSSGFKRFDRINFGARMALFNYNDTIVVWSALPYSEGVKEALKMSSGAKEPNVKYVVIPDREHTMAAKSFKEQFPQLKIIAMEGVDLGKSVPIDYVVTLKYKNQLIDAQKLKEIGISDPVILDNFEFVYLPSHANLELVMYDKQLRALFQADLLFNLKQGDGNEQFSKHCGHEGGNPFSGFSYLARFMHPDSKFGRFFMNKAVNSGAAAEGLQKIYGWDFEKVVMCHGLIIESGGREVFRKVFASAIDKK